MQGLSVPPLGLTGLMGDSRKILGTEIETEAERSRRRQVRRERERKEERVSVEFRWFFGVPMAQEEELWMEGVFRVGGGRARQAGLRIESDTLLFTHHRAMARKHHPSNILCTELVYFTSCESSEGLFRRPQVGYC